MWPDCLSFTPKSRGNTMASIITGGVRSQDEEEACLLWTKEVSFFNPYPSALCVMTFEDFFVCL